MLRWPPISPLFPYTTLFRSSPMTISRALARRLLEPMAGFEPATYGLRNRCSTTELHRQVRMSGTCVDRKSTRLNSSHLGISYAVFCLKKNKTHDSETKQIER